MREDSHSLYRLVPALLPAAVREGACLDDTPLTIGFELPLPEGVVHVARTHPLVEALGSYLTDTALDGGLPSVAARCGAIRTRAVTTRTTLLLLRARMHLDVSREHETASLLAEECIVTGYRGQPAAASWLPSAEAERLLAAEPAGNVLPGQREHWLHEAMAALPQLEEAIGRLVQARAEEVLAAHQRVRDAAKLRGVRTSVRPVLPADVLGLYVLMPAPPTG